MLTSLSNIDEENEGGTKRHALLQSEKTTVSDKPSEPSRTPAEAYIRFSGEQLRCNFSHPLSSMQSSSLPLVMVKVVVTEVKRYWFPARKWTTTL